MKTAQDAYERIAEDMVEDLKADSPTAFAILVKLIGAQIEAIDAENRKANRQPGVTQH